MTARFRQSADFALCRETKGHFLGINLMTLYKHQINAIGRARQGNLGIFHEPGCGKTCTALHIIRHWIAKGCTKILVVCPVSIIESAWLADCATFTPERDIISVWDTKPAERIRKLQEEHEIYVINFDQLKILFNEIVKKEFDVLIIDESSKIKSQNSEISKAVLALSGIRCRGSRFVCNRPIPRRYLMTGTPAPNSYQEYWAQAKVITGPGNAVFSDNFYSFRGQYFYSIPLGRVCKKWEFRKDMQQEFMDKLATIADVVRKQDAVDLPPQTNIIRKVYLSPAEQKAYDTLKNDLVLRFGNQQILATSAVVEIMKLRQLTSGFAYTDTSFIQTGTSKLNELKELLEEIGNQQVIIWANFRYEISLLLKELSSSAALWSGTPDREKTINDFKSGKCQYLIAHPASGAHGLTFTNCSYNVYFSMNYSYELMEQSINRTHRIGQIKPVTYYYFLADKTIDEAIYIAIGRKQKLSNSILNYLKSSKEENTNVKNRIIHSKTDSPVLAKPAVVPAI
jgi:SNF2 family DNA or RNA helicase